MESKIYKLNSSRIPEIGYLLSIPEGGALGAPLIVFLHGAGERGRDTELVKVHGIPKKLARGEKIPAVVLCPQCPENFIWNDLTFELKELIDAVIAEYGCDPDRVSLTGLSMGGYGTWAMGCDYPGFFSALAPICGGGVSWRVADIGKTPVWAFHGTSDTIVDPENSILMCDGLRKAGGNVELTLLRYVDHDSWSFAYDRTNLVSWLLSQKR